MRAPIDLQTTYTTVISGVGEGDVKESRTPSPLQRNKTKPRQRSRAGAKHKGTVRGWERKMERREYQRKREGRKRRVGPQSQRDERGLVSVSFCSLLMPLWRSDKQAQTDIRTAKKVF